MAARAEDAEAVDRSAMMEDAVCAKVRGRGHQSVRRLRSVLAFSAACGRFMYQA